LIATAPCMTKVLTLSHFATPLRSRSHRAAFTLLDLILVLLVLGALVALMLPSLAAVRGRGHLTRDLSNLSQHAKVFAQYTSDFKDAWPYYADPEADASVVRGARGQVAVAVPYFATVNFWSLFLSDRAYDGQWRGGPFETRPRGPVPRLEYEYARSFIARPEFWNSATRTARVNQLAATRASEVRFPAQKGLLVKIFQQPDDRPILELVDQVPIALADGSARVVRYRELRRPEVFSADAVPERLGPVGGTPVLDTVDGVYGRDL
jgi:type II secretory pathway pseudopilin PulG